MMIIDDLSHLVLTYIAAVESCGGKLSVEALNAYGKQPERIIFNDMYAGQAGRGVLISAQVSSENDEPWISDEAFDRFLSRLHWIEVSDGAVHLTQLGKAVLEAANSANLEGDSTIEVLIDPSNQFAYAQVMNKIAQVGESLVVDPYLSAETAIDLAQIHTVKRVLTGDRNIRKLQGRFSIVMRSRSDFEIRYLDQKSLHDRYVISEAGSVIVLGSSLNSIAHRQGVITPLDRMGSKFISEAYEKLWQQSSLLNDVSESKETDFPAS
ncbi:hypothetical protein [Pseudarthrobacter sp. NamE5]|uniref:hypothetical protein n=1 Tax=Pseudarthrobacter sp. NamE5 TaxID=2576839 RepID=UPI00116F9F36|nr:hypothetical protein [Pseudarthrobacter sp. NamE5]TLM80776.1 hypothetical protein FDW84_18150 [Pseudarthrobacter sp. NamE5]